MFKKPSIRDVLHTVFACAAGLTVAAGTYGMLTQPHSSDAPDNLDASACFALYNTGVLLHGVSVVPPTKVISDALAHAPQGPERVNVVRLSAETVGVEFPSSIAKTYPSLARDYEWRSISSLQEGETNCPRSPGALAIFRKLVGDAYPA
jgi:hypothetical protein